MHINTYTSVPILAQGIPISVIPIVPACMLSMSSDSYSVSQPALDVALQFLQIIAKDASNRHTAAAMTSALFNLVRKAKDVICIPEPSSMTTTRQPQQVFSDLTASYDGHDAVKDVCLDTEVTSAYFVSNHHIVQMRRSFTSRT